MKLRVIDRLIAALAGIILVCLAVVPLADTLFDVGILDRLAKIAAFKSASHILFMVGGGVVVLLAGILCLRVALRRSKRKGFVVQTTDVGELSISIRAIEDLVNKCVAKHDELHVSSTTLDNSRGGLTIGLRVGLATGVNIPLAVNALQKQIKQYVTACSGVDVQEVKVQVEATSAKAKPSIYAVSEMLENPTPLPREAEQVPEVAAEPAPAEVKEPEEKCLHQRLFSEEEQPANMPMPPVEAPVEEVVEAPVEEEQEANIPTEEANVPSDEEVEAFEKKVPAEEIVAAWEKAEEEAAEAAAVSELAPLSGLTDEVEEVEAVEETAEADETEAEEVEEVEAVEESAEFVADEESIAELAALDGAEEAEVAAEGEE
ncbi:MAG: alkaline shock response membrane anchor protein AmaP, partial [Clostridia bacterium]|nr:alkaline shock response membrane anchor protein AmaP [Clostridia bacterium]